MDKVLVRRLQSGGTMVYFLAPDNVKPNLEGRKIGATPSVAGISKTFEVRSARHYQRQRSLPWVGSLFDVMVEETDALPSVLWDIVARPRAPEESRLVPGNE